MSRYLVAYLGTGLAILALDSVWLSLMANRLYRPSAGDMMIDGIKSGSMLSPVIACPPGQR